MKRMLASAGTSTGSRRAGLLARRAAVGALTLAQAACYSYVPAPPGQQQRTASVRVELQQPMSVDLGEITVQNVTRVEGEVVQWADDQLVLSATQLTSGIGQRFLGQYQTVYLPRENIAEVEAKRLSALRTGVVLGLGALLIGVAGSLAGGGGASGDDVGDGAPPTK